MKKPKPIMFQRKLKSNDSQLKEERQYHKEQFTEGRVPVGGPVYK
jgi:hypothetical protein